MSTLKVNNLQVGQDSTATNNLTWFQPGSPDGTIRLGSGNAGSATTKFTFDKDGNLTCVGDITANSIIAPIEGTLDDWIVHAGDTNTKIGFPAADTFEVHAGGGPRLHIDSSGRIGIGQNSPGSYSSGANNIVITAASGSNAGITIDNASGGTDSGAIFFAHGTGANAVGRIRYYHSDDHMDFYTANEERLRIDSNGYIKYSGTSTADETNKLGRLLMPSHDTNEEDVMYFQMQQEGTFNQLELGGGSSSYNAATKIIMRTAAIDTVTGVDRLSVTSTGQVCIGTPTTNYGTIGYESTLQVRKDVTGGNASINLVNGATSNASSTFDINVWQDYRLSTRIVSGRENANNWTSAANQAASFLAFYTNSAGTVGERLRITSAGNVQIDNDSGKFQLGADQDISFYHTGTHGFLENGTGTFYIKGDTISLNKANGGNVLWTNGSEMRIYPQDVGFGGAVPGGTPAGKNVFLAIGDSDTGIVQDGDGQLEIWGNAVEVANFNAIDGYTSTKRVYTTGTGRFGQTRINSTTETADVAFNDLIVGDHSGNRGISILSANGSHSTLGFAKSGANSDGYIQYKHESTATSSWMRIKSSGDVHFSAGGNNDCVNIDESGRLLVGTTGNSISSSERFEVKSTSNGFSYFENNSSSGYAPIYIKNKYCDTGYAPIITVTDGGGNRIGIGLDTTEAMRLHGQGGIEMWSGGTHGSGSNFVKMTSTGVLQIKQTTNTNQGLEWYDPSGNKSASIGWGNGNANFEFKHFRSDSQTNGPYANIDFFTGSTSSPSLAFRIQRTGEVGVNISNPLQTFHVSGTVQVNNFTIRDGGWTSSWDTGISVNQSNAGAVLLVMCCRNWDANDSTGAGMYLVRLGYSGNQNPQVWHVSGNNSWTIDKSSNNTVRLSCGSGNQRAVILWTT